MTSSNSYTAVAMSPCHLSVHVDGLRGSSVHGSLLVTAQSSVTVTRITVALKGTSTTLLTLKTPKERTPRTITEEHVVVDDCVSVSPRYTELATGEHKFPFSFSLPDSTQCKPSKTQLHIHGPLPPSYTSHHLQIQYRITVTLTFKRGLFGSKLSKSLVIPLSPPQSIPQNMNKSVLVQKRFTLPPLTEPPKSFISTLIFGEDPPKPERPIMLEVRTTGVLQLGGSLPIDMSFVSNAVTRLNLHKLTILVYCITDIRAKSHKHLNTQTIALCDMLCNERLRLVDKRVIVPRGLYDSVVAGMSKSFRVCNAETRYELVVRCEVSGEASQCSRVVEVSKAVVVVEHALPTYDEVVGPQMNVAGIIKTLG